MKLLNFRGDICTVEKIHDDIYIYISTEFLLFNLKYLFGDDEEVFEVCDFICIL